MIIWKQILEFAKDTNKSIIFNCNDQKEDWCYLDKTSEKRIKAPREELIKEMYDFAQVEFWMYNLPQFLHLSNLYFNTEIEETNIDNLYSHIADNSIAKDEAIIKKKYDEYMQLSSETSIRRSEMSSNAYKDYYFTKSNIEDLESELNYYLNEKEQDFSLKISEVKEKLKYKHDRLIPLEYNYKLAQKELYEMETNLQILYEELYPIQSRFTE